MQVSNYVDKVTSAHINRPKFIEWLSVMVRMACEIGDAVMAIPSEFAVRNAKGKQLDVIGSYFGLNRVLPYTGDEGVLEDEDFRLYILARILRTRWDGKMDTLVALWQQVYPDIKLKIIDNFDMSIEVECIGSITPAMSEMIQSGLILPIPMGVSVTYTVISFVIPAQTVYLDTGLHHQGQMGIDRQVD